MLCHGGGDFSSGRSGLQDFHKGNEASDNKVLYLLNEGSTNGYESICYLSNSWMGFHACKIGIFIATWLDLAVSIRMNPFLRR